MTRMDDLKEELTHLRGELDKLATDVRWVKWIAGGAVIASFSPKLGGPSPASIVEAAVGLFT